ncbi:MAG: type I 3-dehydroquinate dehydratase [Acidobacteria bacterium]|nr:type I 3-dehydroquinate dehydratase [Acidobacteriota bacterium]
MTQVCVPLSLRTGQECRDKMAELAPHCDIFEIRADAFEYAPDVSLILRQAPRPILWTHRSPDEGGRDNPRQGQRLHEYHLALQHGARWVDVEWKSGLGSALSSFAENLVLSFHDFQKTPLDIAQQVMRMAEVPCKVIKVAAQVNQTEDLERLVECAHWLKRRGKRFVVLGMGENGKLLRLLSPCLGSEWTYVALDAPTAEGQLTGADLELYRFHYLCPDSKIFAVIGNPVVHSRSPWLHNSAYQAMALNAIYVAICVDNLGVFLRLADKLGILGWSVTLPWKAEMARCCVLQDTASRMSGVVNTVRKEGEVYLGWNTDWVGFVEPLRERRRISGLRACVVGTGGVARTAVAALVSEGAQVVVLGRREEALRAFATEFNTKTYLLGKQLEISGELIVNATSVGMSPATEAMAVPLALLRRFEIAYDLIYIPRQTRFLRAAEELGLETISGWEMFIRQAVEQIRIFTGKEPTPAWLEMQLVREMEPQPWEMG